MQQVVYIIWEPAKPEVLKTWQKATFSGLDKEAKIEFIPMPEDIRDKYQYFTEANMQKLKDAGYSDSFYSLEEGVMIMWGTIWRRVIFIKNFELSWTRK